jgi:hypothetical protein
MSGLGDMMAVASLGALISNRTPNKPAINQNNKSKKEKLSTKDIYSANAVMHMNQVLAKDIKQVEILRILKLYQKIINN